MKNPKRRKPAFHGFPKGCASQLARAAEAALGGKDAVTPGEINIVMVSDARIRALNRQYRGTDRITDVLTFKFPGKPLCGDIYISSGRSRKQSKEAGNTWFQELCYLVLHGVLHLLDYTDYRPAERKIMFAIQDRIFKQFKNPASSAGRQRSCLIGRQAKIKI